jgi:hypothetical protein
MNTNTKLTALGVLLAGSLSGTQMVRADLNLEATEPACAVPEFTMQTWLDKTDGCTVGDKTWTLITTSDNFDLE